MSVTSAARHPFPVGRWIALAWLLFFLPYGWTQLGPWNLVYFCDVAVILTCIGLWTGSGLLLASQALFSILVQGVWTLDILLRLHTGRSLIPGTEWMLNPEIPLFFKMVSLFHAVWPFLLIWSLRRVGYDRRGLPLQAVITVVVVCLSRLAPAKLNINLAHELLGRSWQPAALHLGILVTILIVLVYWPTHVVLARLFPPPKTRALASREGPPC
jgi:hypothetical protein